MQLLDPMHDPSTLTADGYTLIPALSTHELEVDRQLHICNACRYCEGFCAVFPAMTLRLDFVKADINYLANLCHNCGACLPACQYATPHEFAINIPQALAKVRLDTYTEYAWPASFGKLYKRNGLTLALATSGGLVLFLLLTLLVSGTLFPGQLAGNFYRIFAHNTLALMFGAVFCFSALALGIGVTCFWRGITPASQVTVDTAAAALEATQNVLELKYLDGGHGEGCNDESDRFTLWRRRFHHLTFYGFMLCLAATCVATVYHFAGQPAPYPLFSPPVLLGTLGGIGLLIGPAGLLRLSYLRDPALVDSEQRPMDRAFIALLLLVSLTGLALLVWRDSDAMALLLAMHLGVVMAFFLTMPYGKFAHGIFRSAALFKSSLEKRQPGSLKLSDD